MISKRILLPDFLPDLTQTSRLRKSTYLCFSPTPHEGFLLKHSHMLGLRRGLEGGGGEGVQTSKPFTERLAAKGASVKAETEMCASVCLCERVHVECLRERMRKKRSPRTLWEGYNWGERGRDDRRQREGTSSSCLSKLITKYSSSSL